MEFLYNFLWISRYNKNRELLVKKDDFSKFTETCQVLSFSSPADPWTVPKRFILNRVRIKPYLVQYIQCMQACIVQPTSHCTFYPNFLTSSRAALQVNAFWDDWLFLLQIQNACCRCYRKLQKSGFFRLFKRLTNVGSDFVSGLSLAGSSICSKRLPTCIIWQYRWKKIDTFFRLATWVTQFRKGSKLLIVAAWHFVFVSQCPWSSFKNLFQYLFHLWHCPQGVELPWRLTFLKKWLKMRIWTFFQSHYFRPNGFKFLNYTFVVHFLAFWKIEVVCSTIKTLDN